MPQEIESDSKRLKQIMLNLLSNAFKFTESGKIEIKCSVRKGLASVTRPVDHYSNHTMDLSKSVVRENSFYRPSMFTGDLNLTVNSRNPGTDENTFHTHLAIEVIDTGCGMDEKSRKELFNKFGTSIGEKGVNTNGLGLGLYLSKEICNVLGGDIT